MLLVHNSTKDISCYFLLFIERFFLSLDEKVDPEREVVLYGKQNDGMCDEEGQLGNRALNGLPL